MIQGALWTDLLASLSDTNEVNVTVKDAKGTIVHSAKTQIDSDGKYSAEFNLPANANNGVYTKFISRP